MNRRNFIKTVAGAAPYVITTAALGNAHTAAASDRITVGFIGTGIRGGDGLIKNFLRQEDCQCVAVCDTFRDRREQRAKQINDFYAGKSGSATYKGAAMIADFRDLLHRADIDAVCIATPDHWHVPILVAAARAGKDVYVEKPLSPSIQQDFLARTVIQQTKRVFQYGTQQRDGPHVRFGCELVRSGRIGNIQEVEVIAPTGAPGGSTASMPVPEGFDYEMWQGPAPERPYNDDRCLRPGHYHIYDYSIGFLGGWGAHPLDVLDWGFPTPMVPVEYEGTGLIPVEGLYNTVMNWEVRGKYQNGMTLTFKTGPDSTKFVGTDGWIMISRKEIKSEPASLIAGLGPPSRFSTMETGHARNFLDAIRKQAAPSSPIDSAVRSDLISHLSNIAVRTGRRIKWDPVNEKIVGDHHASKMMNRPARKAWDIV